jgi:molybdopterin-binding protein
MISARNQIQGKIISLKTGSVMSEVVVDIGGGNEIVSLISASSARRLKLKKGKTVLVVIKSTEVMIASDDE